MNRSLLGGAVLSICLAADAASAQTPQPFPKPAEPARPQPERSAPGQRPPKVLPPEPAQPQTIKQTTQPVSGEPSEATLGMPVYPGAQFVTSYDAGRGQRYYLFGTNTGFSEIVVYYRTMLKQRGELTFEAPPIHMFEVGRFREEAMAFPPSITVKDYTWGGSAGYVNPKPGAQPTHFRTIIQVVPAPPAAPDAKR